jgi:hypothetical protein
LDYWGPTFSFAPAVACIGHNFYIEKLAFYGMVLRSVACVAFVHKATDKIKTTFFNPSE